MKHKLVISRSSYLTTMPVLIAFLIFGVLSAVWEWIAVSALLLFLFLLAMLSRIWAQAAISRLSVGVEAGGKGVFPGESFTTTVTVRNEKLLPVLWMELFLPLSKNHCLIPEENRQPEEWEKPSLTEWDVSDTLVGSFRIPGLLWHEERSESIRWTAVRRGVYATKFWRIRTGDGFGLAQVDTKADNNDIFAVFPALRDVDPAFFLRKLWNEETGAKGVMEDLTLIRSVRPYSASDPAKHINWRLKARGLPLQVNIYEDTLPRGVHFILDGESFSGPEPHLEELEETLSLLASLTVELETHQVLCGLSLPMGKGNEPVSVLAEEGTEALLWALAGYETCEKKKDENGMVVKQFSQFDEAALFVDRNSVGRYYYVVYDLEQLPYLLLRLDSTNTTILTWKDDTIDTEFETVCLRGFFSGGVL